MTEFSYPYNGYHQFQHSDILKGLNSPGAEPFGPDSPPVGNLNINSRRTQANFEAVRNRINQIQNQVQDNSELTDALADLTTKVNALEAYVGSSISGAPAGIATLSAALSDLYQSMNIILGGFGVPTVRHQQCVYLGNAALDEELEEIDDPWDRKAFDSISLNESHVSYVRLLALGITATPSILDQSQSTIIDIMIKPSNSAWALRTWSITLEGDAESLYVDLASNGAAVSGPSEPPLLWSSNAKAGSVIDVPDPHNLAMTAGDLKFVLSQAGGHTNVKLRFDVEYGQ